MLRPTNFKDEYFQSLHQGSGEGNVHETQHFFIGEESRASPADTNQDDEVEHLQLEAFLAQQRFEMRTQEMSKKKKEESAENAAEQLRQQELELQENASARMNAQLQSNRAEAQQALEKQ